MKNYLFNSIVLCSLLAAFTECSSDDLIMDENSDSESVTLRNTLILQPGNNLDNLWITTFPNSFPPYNYPAGYNQTTATRNDELDLFAWTHTGYHMNSKVILKFNILSYVRPTNKINKAILKLKSKPNPQELNVTANHGPANAFYVQQISSYFTAGSITSSGLPSVSNQVTVAHSNAPVLDLDIDVTALVKSMVNNNRDYGFLLRLVSETTYNARFFCSATYPDVNMRPSLVIDFD